MPLQISQRGKTSLAISFRRILMALLQLLVSRISAPSSVSSQEFSYFLLSTFSVREQLETGHFNLTRQRDSVHTSSNCNHAWKPCTSKLHPIAPVQRRLWTFSKHKKLHCYKTRGAKNQISATGRF